MSGIHNKWVVGVGDDGIPVALNLNAVERVPVAEHTETQP